MKNFIVATMLLSIFLVSVSGQEGGLWQVLDGRSIRIHYQQGNGSEAKLLAAAGGPVLHTVERDLGLQASGPLEVRILPPNGGEDQRDGAPHWAVGYVTGGSSEVILRGNWVRTYPFGDMLSLFAHETTHALLNTLPAADSLPRWFQEGVAVSESRHWSLRDAFALGTTVLIGSPTPLARLTHSFPSEDSEARAAYAESFHFVSYLQRRHGSEAIRSIVREMKTGASFPEAFRQALGNDLAVEEASWRTRVNFAYRWIPALTSTGVLWMVITLLVLLGRLARIRRDRAILESWSRQGLD